MTKEAGRHKAIGIAREKLIGLDLVKRLERLELPAAEQGSITVRLFGQDAVFDLTELSFKKPDGEEVCSDDQIIFLHYLLNDIPLKSDPDYITFRDLPGGKFYWGPFQSRSIKPLVKRIGNDLDLLKKQLERFDWTADDKGDFSARIHVVGKIHILLVYHLGDEEFPPAVDLLFPRDISHIYNAEDAAVIAGRICIGLL